jgi:aspartate/methionine/tyrosine aminotransferase
MNDFIVPQKMQGLDGPPSLAILRRVLELRQKGVKVINFVSRDDTPKRAKDAAVEMLASPANSAYTDIRGLLALRQAIAEKLLTKNNIQANSETDIIVSSGAGEGISSTLLALLSPGDEVLLEDPCFLGFEPAVQLAGAISVRIPLVEDDGFKFSIDALRERVTSRTRLLILCNPNNPIGRIFGFAELEAIAKVADEFNFLVLVDEAYEHFIYDGLKHVSMAAIGNEISRRIITIQTVSKIYHMHGWRVGWVVAHPDIIKPILATHARLVTCPTSFAQAGAIAAIEGCLGEGDVPITELVKNYQDRRDVMISALNAIPGVNCPTPQGAYFAFPDFKTFGMPSTELSTYLLESGRVATTPGSAFGKNGEGHLRLPFTCSIDEIKQGVGQIAEALAKI